MLLPEITDLTHQLKSLQHTITIETAGTVDRDVAVDLMSISPKLSNSTPQNTPWQSKHDQRRHRPEVIQKFNHAFDCQFKFVICTPQDIDEVKQYLSEFPEVHSRQIYLMPEGTNTETIHDRLEWMSDIATTYGWNISPRSHIEQYGHQRGT